jgi:hypothetical protein
VIDINARQVHAYLDAYRNSPSIGELDVVWGDVKAFGRFFAQVSQRTGQKRQSNTPIWRWRPAARSGRDSILRPWWVGLGVIARSLLVGWGVYDRSRFRDEWDA